MSIRLCRYAHMAHGPTTPCGVVLISPRSRTAWLTIAHRAVSLSSVLDPSVPDSPVPDTPVPDTPVPVPGGGVAVDPAGAVP